MPQVNQEAKKLGSLSLSPSLSFFSFLSLKCTYTVRAYGSLPICVCVLFVSVLANCSSTVQGLWKCGNYTADYHNKCIMLL